MTDPVDTDALRDVAWEKYAALNGIHPHSIDRDTFNEGWDAAADEVNWLREHLTVQEQSFADALCTIEQAGLTNHRLRTAIENAPHDYDHICTGDDPLIMTECTCWKAGAL